MASVSRRRFSRRVSVVPLLEGTVDVCLLQRAQVENTVEVSVWEMIEDGERDRMERYVFDLSMDEVRKLIAGLQRHVTRAE